MNERDVNPKLRQEFESHFTHSFIGIAGLDNEEDLKVAINLMKAIKKADKRFKGSAAVHCIFADYIKTVYTKWRRERFGKCDYNGSIRRLVGKRYLSGIDNNNMAGDTQIEIDGEMPNYPPGSDHGKLYKSKDGEFIYITEPYPFGLKKMKAIIEFCERWGLEASIYGSSAHFIGKTVEIRFYNKNSKNEKRSSYPA